MRIHDDTGAEIDATFSVEIQHDGFPSIVLDSRRGRSGQRAGRNTAYQRGLRLILYRLLVSGFTINAVLLDTTRTQQKGLTEDQRTIPIEPHSYPILPVHCDLTADLAAVLGRGMAPIASRAQRNSSGDRTRRIRMNVTPPAGWSDPSVSLETVLAYGRVTVHVPGHAQEPSLAIAPRTEVAFVGEPSPSIVYRGLASREPLESVTSVTNADHSREFLMVALFLAKYGAKQPGNRYRNPPREVGTIIWKEAFLRFHSSLGDGRTEETFLRTLRWRRYTFDAHVSSGRSGQTQNDRPAVLSPLHQLIFDEWGLGDSRRDEHWLQISQFMTNLPAPSPITPQVAKKITAIAASSTVDGSHWAMPSGPTEQERAAHARVLSSIAALSSDFPSPRTEGGEHVQTSTRRERNPNLRAAALRLHGASCMGCAFNFQATYGIIGSGFAHVHHAVPISQGKRRTDPRTDLVVLCPNCHAMVHAERGIVLSIPELKAHITAARAALNPSGA
jgi:5-methylcytosine-specific restriction enzyme A